MEATAFVRRGCGHRYPGLSRRGGAARLYFYKIMATMPQPLDLKRLKVFPLAQRQSMSRIEDILVNPDLPPPICSEPIQRQIKECARQIAAARQCGASVMFLYGAHLVKNGAAAIVERLLAKGWVTH